MIRKSPFYMVSFAFYRTFFVTVGHVPALIGDSHVAMLPRSHDSYMESPHAEITDIITDVPKEEIH
jgi:hypothetical protein